LVFGLKDIEKLWESTQRLMRGVWCEIETEGHSIRIIQMHYSDGRWVFAPKPEELPIGRTSLTFYVDGVTALHNDQIFVEQTPWLLLSFWTDTPPGEPPDTVTPGCMYYTGTLEAWEQDPNRPA
jgi:hypothetical protein